MSTTSEKKCLVSYFSFVSDVSVYELGCIGYHICVRMSRGNGQLIRLTSAARSAIVVGQMRRTAMNKYTITIYEENDHSYNWPIGEVDIRASEFYYAETIAALMFDNSGRVITVEEDNDE